jgi:glycosyltransferase involved in cell wall biosynthesis
MSLILVQISRNILKKNVILNYMITFIIPTIGKPGLQKAIESIEKQTSDNWKAIVVFDGIEPTISISNPKITVMKIEKAGVGNNGAANVRNYGMKHVDSEWIGFLDDDDTIAPDYVETFNNELVTYPFVDVIIFRMHRPDIEPIVLPELKTENFYVNYVGISFAFKKQIFDTGIIMSPSPIEDFEYLSTLRDKNYCMMISPYIKYFVDGRDDANVVSQSGDRVIINNNQKEGFEISEKKIWWIFPFLLWVFLMAFIFLFNKKTFYKYKYKFLFAGLLFFAVGYLHSGHLSI